MKGVSVGRLEVICGGMFCGKTEELIRRLVRAQIAQQQIQVFKPAIDNRFDAEKVVSHSGIDHEALPVETAMEILQHVQTGTSVVAIDEVQFFEEDIYFVVEELTRQGIRVICAGLDMDFRGLPFGSMPMLLARAEEVTKLTAICTVCFGQATRTQRLIDGGAASFNDPIVLVGAAETYEARCRKCHEVVLTRSE